MEENSSMPEEKSMEKTSEKSMMTPGSPQKNNMPIIIGIIVILLLLIGAAVAYFLLNDKEPNLENDEELVKFLVETQTNLEEFDGVVEGTTQSDGEQVGTFSLDTKNNIVYATDVTTEQEAYYDEDSYYYYENGQWYVTSYAGLGFSYDELADVSISGGEEITADDYEFKGTTDCPNSSGTCYEIYDSNDSTTAFITKKGFIDTITSDIGFSFIYTYKEGGSIEIPQEAIDSAIETSGLLPTNSTLEDEFDVDEYLENLQLEGEDYQDLLDQIESL